MSNIITPDSIRELPIYQAGLSAGIDLGLQMALEAITRELARQADAAAVAADPHQLDAARHEYCSGSRLLAVARTSSRRSGS